MGFSVYGNSDKSGKNVFGVKEKTKLFKIFGESKSLSQCFVLGHFKNVFKLK